MQQCRTRAPWWAYYRGQTARAGSVIVVMSWCGFGDITPLFHTKLLTVNFDRYHSPFLKMNRRQSFLSLYFLGQMKKPSRKSLSWTRMEQCSKPYRTDANAAMSVKWLFRKLFTCSFKCLVIFSAQHIRCLTETPSIIKHYWQMKTYKFNLFRR